MSLGHFSKKIVRALLPPSPNPFDAIYQRLQKHTMVPRECFLTNLYLAQSVGSIEGGVIECGVWKGGMIAGIASILGPKRKYYLFDSFEGLPPAQKIDGTAAIEWQQNKTASTYFDNCRAGRETATEAMNLAKVPDFELVVGWFDTTVPAYKHGAPIALLRLDGDWYDSTTICLENLFHRVAPAGIVIIDDYHTWDGCSRAVHDFLSKHSATERIDCLNGVCFIRKRSSESAQRELQK